MSRVGKKPIKLPEGVTASVEQRAVFVAGKKGQIKIPLPEGVEVKVDTQELTVHRLSNQKKHKSLHGALQRIISNAVVGVSQGWSKKLELVGTGYRARIEGEDIILTVGHSHPIKVTPLEGITFSIEDNKIVVTGSNKHLVGQVAASIRSNRPPEPYKGKGIRYDLEKVRRKPGKTAKVGPAV